MPSLGLVSSATISSDPITALYYGTNYLAIVLVLLAMVLVEDPLPDLRQSAEVSPGSWALLLPSACCVHPFTGFTGTGGDEIAPRSLNDVTGRRRLWGWLRLEIRDLPGMRPSRRWWRSPGYAKGEHLPPRRWGILLAASRLRLNPANGRTEIIGVCRGVAVHLGCGKSQAYG